MINTKSLHMKIKAKHLKTQTQLTSSTLSRDSESKQGLAGKSKIIIKLTLIKMSLHNKIGQIKTIPNQPNSYIV